VPGPLVLVADGRIVGGQALIPRIRCLLQQERERRRSIE
jgi:hypothetical protein